jgi:hypothetical protein
MFFILLQALHMFTYKTAVKYNATYKMGIFKKAKKPGANHFTKRKYTNKINKVYATDLALGVVEKFG